MSEKAFSAKKLAECGLFTCIIIICSWISVRIFAVPYTLQTFAIALAVFCLGPVYSSVSIGVYLLLGMAGVPVFANFNSGIAAIAGPTGGFLLGFFFTALVGGLLCKYFGKNRLLRIIWMSVGLALSYGSGMLWFWLVYDGGGLFVAFTACVLPFIIPDLIKTALAEIVSSKIQKRR